MEYYINIGHKNKETAAEKAPRDISKLCEKQGMESFPMPTYPVDKGKIYKKMWLLFICPIFWIKLWVTVKRGDIILYQHPMYGNRVSAFFVAKIKRYKDCKFIAVINDLESLRNGIEGVYKIKRSTIQISDNKLLKLFNVIICHNDRMKEYLVSQGFNANNLVSLGIFDYLCEYNAEEKSKGKTPSIAIAGNLISGKCSYIYQIINRKIGKNSNLTIHLYGKDFDESKSSEGMIYHGSYSPEDLPMHIEGDFGLVWDGTSADTCTGNTGEYLRYNNPHKTSLYLASGMPVIVWSQSAIADFVLKNGVGILVDDLRDLDHVISNITDDEYNQMCKNVEIIGKRIRDGEYSKTALKKTVDIIQKENIEANG